MSRRRPAGPVLIALSLIAGFGNGVARAGIGINTLRGIDKIKVVIEDLTTDSTMAGVTEERLQTQSELALKQIGITAIADSDSAGAESLLAPILYLSLSTDRADGFHTFLIRLELLQAVTLARDAVIRASSAITWSAARFGRVDEGDHKLLERTLIQEFAFAKGFSRERMKPPSPALHCVSALTLRHFTAALRVFPQPGRYDQRESTRLLWSLVCNNKNDESNAASHIVSDAFDRSIRSRGRRNGRTCRLR